MVFLFSFYLFWRQAKDSFAIKDNKKTDINSDISGFSYSYVFCLALSSGNIADNNMTDNMIFL